MSDERYRFEFRPVNGQIPEMPSNEELRFGEIMAPYVVAMEHEGGGLTVINNQPMVVGGAWSNKRIEPYTKAQHDPLITIGDQYCRRVFEGAKVFLCPDGKVRSWRLVSNATRMLVGARYHLMPDVPTELFVAAVEAGVKVLAQIGWIPKGEGYSLYVRPVLEAIDEALGVRNGSRFRFYVAFSPSGLYYKSGVRPNQIWVETNEARTPSGRIGSTKYAGLYGNTGLLERARAQLASHRSDAEIAQLLYLASVDGDKHPLLRRVEEFGTANFVTFGADGALRTPSADRGTILPSISKDTVMQLHRLEDQQVVEGDMLLINLLAALQRGGITEAVGTGTAATLAPTGRLYMDLPEHGDGVQLMPSGFQEIQVGNGTTGTFTERYLEWITGMQIGEIDPPERFGRGASRWSRTIEVD